MLNHSIKVSLLGMLIQFVIGIYALKNDLFQVTDSGDRDLSIFDMKVTIDADMTKAAEIEIKR